MKKVGDEAALSLFAEVERQARTALPIPTPKQVGEHSEVLGVRYSLTSVEGARCEALVDCAGCRGAPLTEWDQVVWLGPLDDR